MASSVRIPTLLVALLAVTAGVPSASAEEDAEAPLLRFERLIDSDLSGPGQRFQAFDTHVMNAFDLNRDGRLEIVSQNDNHRVYVIDPLTGALRAELYNNLPDGWAARDINGAAIGDVNGNGHPDLVVTNSAGTITVFELTGAGEDGAFTFRELWQTTPDPRWFWKDIKDTDGGPYRGYPSSDGTAYVADVEGNGKLWVFTQSDNLPGQYAFNHEGKLMWGNLNGDGNGGPVVADLDGDGRLEAIFATDGGRILVYDALTGDEKWRYHLPEWPGSIPAAPAVVDLDGTGQKVVVFGGRGAKRDPNDPNKPVFEESHAQFAAVNHDGTERWMISPGWANPLVYNTPSTYDVNGDGVKDVVFIDWNTIGHKPGKWEVTGKANLFAVDGRSGDVLWRTQVDSVWSNKDIALADVTGDDVPEVLAEETVKSNGLSVFDIRSGERIFHHAWPEWSWAASRGPLVADFNGDGSVRVVVPLVRGAPDAGWCDGARVSVGCREGALAVFEVPRGGAVTDGNNRLFNNELNDARELPGGISFSVPLGEGPAPGGTPTPPDSGTSDNATEEPPVDGNATGEPDDGAGTGDGDRFAGGTEDPPVADDPPAAPPRWVPAPTLLVALLALAVAAARGRRMT